MVPTLYVVVCTYRPTKGKPWRRRPRCVWYPSAIHVVEQCMQGFASVVACRRRQSNCCGMSAAGSKGSAIRLRQSRWTCLASRYNGANPNARILRHTACVQWKEHPRWLNSTFNVRHYAMHCHIFSKRLYCFKNSRVVKVLSVDIKQNTNSTCLTQVSAITKQ